MNKNTAKNLIIILFLIIVVIVVLILFIMLTRNLNNKNLPESNNVVDNSVDNNTTQNDLDDVNNTVNNDEINTYNKLESVTNEENYFLVKTCMEQYYKSNNLDNPLNVIDKDVISLLNITKKNYKDYNNFDSPIFRIDRIYKQELSGDLDIYVVYHQLQIDSSNSKQTVLFIKINRTDKDFSIYPYEYLKTKNYLNLKQNDKISDISLNINKNNDNVFNDSYYNFTDEEIVKELFSRYKFDVLLDIEHLYNIIDENYKKIKFASIEDFKQYINSNKSDLIIDSLLKYKTEENDEENYTKYVGICSSGKEYVYYTKNLMNYTILLDDYLIVEDKENYDALLPQVQAEYCVKRVIDSINDGNYEFVYDKLNEIQKNNYYKNIKDFRNYIEKTFYSKNNYEIDTDYLILSSTVYQFNMKITDATGEEFTYRNLVMTITLKDDGDFRVSIAQKSD